MPITVPETRLGAQQDDEALRRQRQELRERLLRGETVTVAEGGQISVPDPRSPQDRPSEQKPGIVVPPGKLAASFYWYESDSELLDGEMKAMLQPSSPFRNFQLRKEADGRLAWLGQVTPG